MLPFLAASLILLALSLAGIPQEGAALGAPIGIGGAWLSLVLAIPLPSGRARLQRAVPRRLAEFRQQLDAVGDAPSRAHLETLLRDAHELGLRGFEMAAAVARIRAALDALTLREQLAQGYLPLVIGIEGVGPGDRCRYASPARCGHRRADEIGDLLLTDRALLFRATGEIPARWTDVASVQRADRDIVIALRESPRVPRFTCPTLSDAARGSAIAEHLMQRALLSHA